MSAAIALLAFQNAAGKKPRRKARVDPEIAREIRRLKWAADAHAGDDEMMAQIDKMIRKVKREAQ